MPDDQRLEIQRPPHFREGPEERTLIYPPADYPSAEEIQDYQGLRQADENLHVAVDSIPVPRHESLDFTATRFTINQRIVRIAGNNPSRRRLVIRNDDKTVPVYIGRNQTDSIFTMFELHSDSGNERAELVLFHQAEVWAVCDGSDTTRLSVIAEYKPQTT